MNKVSCVLPPRGFAQWQLLFLPTFKTSSDHKQVLCIESESVFFFFFGHLFASLSTPSPHLPSFVPAARALIEWHAVAKEIKLDFSEMKAGSLLGNIFWDTVHRQEALASDLLYPAAAGASVLYSGKLFHGVCMEIGSFILSQDHCLSFVSSGVVCDKFLPKGRLHLFTAILRISISLYILVVL